MIPVLKWLGGKTRALEEIQKILPDLSKIETYIEPCAGGLAVGLDLIDKLDQNCEIRFSDINEELIVFYNSLIIYNSKFIKESEKLFHSYNSMNLEQRRVFYNQIRKKYNLNKGNEDLFELALDFYFLNKSCHGGVYRVNSKGIFNTSYGTYKKISLCTEKLKQFNSFREKENLIFLHDSIEDSLNMVPYDKNTLVYIDPPYPVGDQSKFKSYTTKDFDHEKLAQILRDLDEEGVKFILSGPDNKNCILRNLYKGFNIKKIRVSRGQTGGNGGQYGELLIYNFKPGE